MADQTANEAKKALCTKIGFPENRSNADLKKALTEHVSKLIHDNDDPDMKKSQEKEIEDICTAFFEYETLQYKENAAKSVGVKDHQDAAALKSRGGAIVIATGKEIIKFLLCEKEIRSGIQKIKERIAKVSKEIPEEYVSVSSGDVQWSYDLPEKIAIYSARRDLLAQDMEQLQGVEFMVELLDPVFSYIQRSLQFVLKEEQARDVLRAYKNNLYKQHYLQANEAVQQAHEKYGKVFFQRRKRQKREQWKILLVVTELTTKLMKKIASVLSGREKRTFLNYKEYRVTFEAIEAQYQKDCEFILKNRIPEMRYRMEALQRELKRLHEIGELEGLMQLREELLKGSLMPMPALKDVTSYDNGPYKRATVLLDQKSESIAQTLKKARQLQEGPEDQEIDMKSLSVAS